MAVPLMREGVKGRAIKEKRTGHTLVWGHIFFSRRPLTSPRLPLSSRGGGLRP